MSLNSNFLHNLLSVTRSKLGRLCKKTHLTACIIFQGIYITFPSSIKKWHTCVLEKDIVAEAHVYVGGLELVSTRYRGSGVIGRFFTIQNISQELVYILY